MGGRNAKPIQLHLAQGNPNRLTKSAIARRQQSEVQLGEHKLRCPDYVKRDVVAYKKWREIAKLFNDFDAVSSSDIGLIGRYCMTFSEYQSLLEMREKIATIDLDTEESEQAYEVLEEEYGKRQAGKLFNKINFILSVGGVLSLDKAINAKMDALVKMEDRMFLNPLAKVKNVPKKEPEKEDPLASKGFGNI